ncbi:MAG: Tim44 domain-containing protein [Emcibacter sp.]|nr:Tim44 domain-containing protein [Emcibacter sp.]MBL4894250.1 Tim44 domain-containing protein [Emcibacter sp.]
MQTESESFDLIIILALVAVFIIFQLRRTLGKKTGYDPTKDRPKDQNNNARQQNDEQNDEQGAEDNVFQIRPDVEQDQPAMNLGLAKSSPHYDVIEKINRFDSSFTLRNFFDGAEYAYGLILNSFWSKDRKTLRSMLSRQVFEQFEGAIGQLEKQNLQSKNKLMDVEKIDLVEANLTGSLAEVTVEFTSHMIMSTLDSDNNLVEGSADKSVKISDIWTFCRDVKSADPNWTLVATRTS